MPLSPVLGLMSSASTALAAPVQTAATPADLEFTDAHFELLRTLVARHAGIHLNDSKRQLVYGRVARRIRALRLSGFDAYCTYLRHNEDGETEHFINALTTNLTSFFREEHHFEYLTGTVLPALLRANADTRRLRIWSAGCASGEEAWSIAMSVRECLPADRSWKLEILATDVDSSVLAAAHAGVYPHARLQALSPFRRGRWFSVDGCAPGHARVKDELRDDVRFASLNLIDEAWPISGRFDVVFCRNVVIYFDKATQCKVLERIADVVATDGWLFVGHAESLFGNARFEHVGQTVYRPRMLKKTAALPM